MKKISLFLLMTALIFSQSFAGKKDKDHKKKDKNTYVMLSTTYGDMILKLYNETPKHKEQFTKLVNAHFFDSLLFHRVISNFMIQGGDPNSKNAKPGEALGEGEAPGERIPAEFNPKLYHKKGALAAARDNNQAKASSNCQFYIVQGKPFTDEELDRLEQRSGWKYSKEQREMYKTVGGTPHLDNNYTVFGEVVSGMDVIDKIATVKTGPNDRPQDDVRMTMHVLKKYKESKK